MPVKPSTTLRKTKTNVYRGRPISESLNNGYFVVDADWTVKYWNKAAERILGVVKEDIVGKNFWKVFAKLIPVEFYAVHDRAFLENNLIHFQEYWAEMGSWFDVTTWYCDNDLCVSFKNSSSIQEPTPDTYQNQLNSLTELYRLVTEITNDCLWEWDLLSNEILWIDGGHKRAFGYPIENTIVPASFWKNCIHPDDRDRVLSKLKYALGEKQDTIWEDEYRFKQANGTFCHVHDRGHIVYDDDNHTPTRIIGATQDINKRVQLEKQLEKQKAEQQLEITSAVITAQENERASIGMELHDNLGQLMAVTKMYIQMVKQSDENREVHIDKSLGYLQDVIDVIRKISKSLIIPPSHIISLSENIKILVADMIAVTKIQVEFRDHGMSKKELPEELQINIFRIIQEQTNNIIKHADASQARIVLSREKDKIVLLVADNGKGHDILKEKKGVGIINIKSRVELCRGNLTITSEPGKGYELKATFPV